MEAMLQLQLDSSSPFFVEFATKKPPLDSIHQVHPGDFNGGKQGRKVYPWLQEGGVSYLHQMGKVEKKSLKLKLAPENMRCEMMLVSFQEGMNKNTCKFDE